ncbi:MAG: 50S ribosomal protein L4 [Endomicrobiia bacterium]
MKLKVLNKEGKDTGRIVELSDSIFNVEPNDHVIYLDVKRILANKRQGTHKSKQRNEIAGSTRKLKKQKGTGGARAGSIKNPQFRGGGRIFGPQPRDYFEKVNKKEKLLARLSALSYKAKNDAITVVEDFNYEVPKTKNIVSLQNNLKLMNKKSLLVLPKQNNVIYLSSRNLQDFSVSTVMELDTYKILRANNLILFESSVKEFEKAYLK